MKGAGGRDDRRRVRQRESDKSRMHAEEFVDTHLRVAEAIEGMWASSMSLRRHDELIEELLQKVVGAEWPQGKILAALSHLARRSRQIIDRYALQATPFHAPTIDNQLDAYRSESAFHAGVAVRAWDAAFADVLANHRINRQDGFDFWAGLALFSAITRSGVLTPWKVGELFRQLGNPVPWLGHGLNERPAIHFRSEAPVGLYNAGNADAPFVEWRFHPDGLTLALLSRAWKCRWDRVAEDNSFTNEVSAYRLIVAALFDRKQRDDVRRLNQLCKAATWLFETRKGVAMPRALLDIATGAQAAVPLEQRCHDHLFAKPRVAAVTAAAPTEDSGATVSTDPLDWTDAQRLFLEMTRASLQLYTEDRRRITPARAVQALLDQSTHFREGTIEHLLTVWLENRISGNSPSNSGNDWKDLSGRRKRTIVLSSALRYHNWISIPLLDRLAGRELTTLSLADFEDLYDDILAEEPNAREQSSIAGRLADFHNFATQHRAYRFPSLRDSLTERTLKVRRVRARTLSFAFYSQARATIRSSAPDPLVGDQLELVLVLAYRCGLRIGEIVKLRLRDVEPSEERTLFIRQNSYGTNKSHAARRKIASGLILTDNERVLLDRQIAVRQRLGNLSGTFFLAPGGAMPVDRASLSSIINSVLRTVTGDSGWTFHHLRHSAANNMILATLDASSLAEKLSGWDARHQISVKRAVLREIGPLQHRLSSIAAFLGHAGPAQTLQSYFHLAPELTAERTGQAGIMTERHLYAEALNMPPSRIAECAIDADIVRRFHSRWRKLSERPAAVVAQASPSIRADPARGDRPAHAPVDQCLLFLRETERGAEVEHAAALAQITVSQAERWLSNARAVAELKTRHGNSRFFAKTRVDAFRTRPGTP